jgi:hypothetical protein
VLRDVIVYMKLRVRETKQQRTQLDPQHGDLAARPAVSNTAELPAVKPSCLPQHGLALPDSAVQCASYRAMSNVLRIEMK